LSKYAFIEDVKKLETQVKDISTKTEKHSFDIK